MIRFGVWLVILGVGLAFVPAAEPAKGKKALEGTAFIRGFWPTFAYDNAWKQWGVAAKPKDYDAAFRDRYGLHPAPYENGRYPMGLRKADYLITSGIAIDCMTCHGGSILGQSYVGLGNSSLDVQSLFEDMYKAGGANVKLPFTFSQTRGTNEAGAFSVYLLGFRSPDLTFTEKYRDLDLHDDSCEDVPAWWLLKKKKTMYYTGATDAKSVRSIMQFMMHPLTLPKEFEAAESAFQDVRAHLDTITPPKYPWPIDAKLAAKGREIFTENCAKCHGTYGDKPTYPNKVIPLAEIGTDRKRFDNITRKFGEAYNVSWFAQEKGEIQPIRETTGYQAPPLDGIWATAPYFHNGSVPTLEGVLNSTTRPKIFTRSFRTAEADYDRTRIGWKVTECLPPDAKLPAHERRKVYDTTQPGRSNAGHTYGDDLTPTDRQALLEYLKTL
ncbi:MAG: c-type cytochrome [Fimbriiglobus sp.]